MPCCPNPRTTGVSQVLLCQPPFGRQQGIVGRNAALVDFWPAHTRLEELSRPADVLLARPSNKGRQSFFDFRKNSPLESPLILAYLSRILARQRLHEGSHITAQSLLIVAGSIVRYQVQLLRAHLDSSTNGVLFNAHSLTLHFWPQKNQPSRARVYRRYTTGPAIFCSLNQPSRARV